MFVQRTLCLSVTTIRGNTQRWMNCMKRSANSLDVGANKTMAAKKQLSTIPLGQPMKIRANPAVMKIDSKEFQSVFTDELRTLIALFRKYNYELRIAGGAVRDIIMEITPKDIDLATTATPDQMKEMFTAENVRMINAKGEKHGTITPRINNKEQFEVTTLRIDVVTDGRHAEVQFTTDWQVDANRRDLTINSMFLDFDGVLYDYFFGYEDLKQRRVLFVGDASVRVQEDYLRILRYFRFYGRIADDAENHDIKTLQALTDNAAGLTRISGERIWTELQKILVGRFSRELIGQMRSCNLLSHCGLPKELNMIEFERLHASLKQFPEPHLPILFMIALLHNEEEALLMHHRLKLSAFERDLAIFITQTRDKVTSEYGTLRDCQRACMQPNTSRSFVEELIKYSGQRELYEDLKTWVAPRFPVNGKLLIQHGCPNDRKMGVVIQQLKDIWIDSDFSITSEDLINLHLPKVLAQFRSPLSGAGRKKEA